MPLVRARDLWKTYPGPAGGVDALRGVDLDVAEGEMLAVMGSSGSGKTTFLFLLGALDAPTRGEIAVDGRSLGTMSRADRVRYRRSSVGLVFQQYNLVTTLTAQENVELPLRYAGVRGAEARRRAGELIERVGLRDRRDHLPEALSGGEQQRAAVARALAARPRLLLADEPTGNLDTQNAGTVIALIEELRRETGLTVLLVTHNPEIAAHAQRSIRMADGRVVGA